jgi:diketogulonate reductase-like aldo/keto reductase
MQNPVLNHPVLVDMASRYDRSVAAVIISWAIQEGAIVIPKTSKADHVDDNARVLTASPSGDAISPPKLTTFLTFRDIAIIRALDGSLEK